MKTEMFRRTSTPHAPWTVVRSNDKKRGRVNVVRHVLSIVPFADKNDELVGRSDPNIVGSPQDISSEHGEPPDTGPPAP